MKLKIKLPVLVSSSGRVYPLLEALQESDHNTVLEWDREEKIVKEAFADEINSIFNRTLIYATVSIPVIQENITVGESIVVDSPEFHAKVWKANEEKNR